MHESLRQAFLEDGAVLIKNLLNQEQLDRCRAAYAWPIENQSPHASRMFGGTVQQSHVDNANPLAWARLENLVSSLPFGQLFADLWGSKNVWYFAEKVFLKAGGRGSRTPWQQDTTFRPWAGMHWGNAWISFESVPKQNALEIIRGSHRGPHYDGTNVLDPNDPIQPRQAAAALPRLPDTAAERKQNPDSYDVLSWATEPGDVVLLHPGSLHGGAPVDEAFPDRHTFVFRFFGDDARFHPLPEHSAARYPKAGILFTGELTPLKPGAPFRHATFRQLA